MRLIYWGEYVGMPGDEFFQRLVITPYQNHIARVFQHLPFLLIVFYHFWFVMVRSVSEDDDMTTILEIRLDVVLFREHRLSLIRKPQPVVI